MPHHARSQGRCQWVLQTLMVWSPRLLRLPMKIWGLGEPITLSSARPLAILLAHYRQYVFVLNKG